MTTDPPLAAIDIGSNSVKLLVGRLAPDGRVAVELDDAVVTRLAQGVDARGRLDPAARARTLAALRGFVETCRARGVERIAAVGTAALRDAVDRDAFLADCAALGLEIEIVDGDTEADIVRLAGARELPGVGDDAVFIDIGGGSTELVWPGGRVSTELGVVRLTERHVDADPPGEAAFERLDAAVRARLDALGLPRAAPALVGSSATCSLVARLHQGLAAHDPVRIHGCRVPRAFIADLARDLAARTQAERLALPGMEPGRADVLLAGAVVLARTAETVGVDAIVVNDRGTRYGVFHRAFG